MARQQSYQLDRDISGSDRLLGTDITGKGTVNISVEDLATYFAQTGSADPSRIGFSFNNAGVFTNNTLDSGEYRLQIAQGGTGFAHVTGIAISNSDRNGVNFLPESDILNGSILKLTGIEESGDVNYALYSVSDVTNITGGKLASVVHVSSSGNLVDNVATITLLSPNSTIIEGSQTVFAGNNTQYPNGPEGFIQAEEGSFFFYEVINGNETEIQIYGPKVGSDAHGWGESKKITPESINNISSSLDESTNVTTVTVHLSDGSEYDFEVPGGQEGQRGAQGVGVTGFDSNDPGAGNDTTVTVTLTDPLTGNTTNTEQFTVSPGAQGEQGDQGIGVSDVSGEAGALGQPTTVVVKGTNPATGVEDGVDLGSFTVASGQQGNQGVQGRFDLEVYLVLPAGTTPTVTGGSYSDGVLTPPNNGSTPWELSIPSSYDPDNDEVLWEARSSFDPANPSALTWSVPFHAGNMGVQGFQGVNVANFTSDSPGAGNDTTVTVTGTNPADPSSDPVDLGTFTVAPGATGGDGSAAALDGDGIGNVTTIDNIDDEIGAATVSISGDAQNMSFNFGVPAGARGFQGIGELNIFRYLSPLASKDVGVTEYDLNEPFSLTNGVPSGWSINVPQEVLGQDLYGSRATYDPSTQDSEGELTLHWSTAFETGGDGPQGIPGEQGPQGISRVELYHTGDPGVNTPTGIQVDGDLNFIQSTIDASAWKTEFADNDYVSFAFINPAVIREGFNYSIPAGSWSAAYQASAIGPPGPQGPDGIGEQGPPGTSYSFQNEVTFSGLGNVGFNVGSLIDDAVPVRANVDLDGLANTDLGNVDSDLTTEEKTAIQNKLGVDAAGTVNSDSTKANTDLGNVDSDLTNDEKTAIRNKIGAGTGSGGSDVDGVIISGTNLAVSESGVAQTAHQVPIAQGDSAETTLAGQKYVDKADALKLNLTGGTLTGDLNVGSGSNRSLNAGTDIHFTQGTVSYLQADTSEKKVFYDPTNTSGGVEELDGYEIATIGDLTSGYTPLNPSGGSGTTTDPAYRGTQTTNPGAFVPNNTGYMSEVEGENAHDGQDFLFTYTDPGQGVDIWAVINLPNDLTNTHTVGFNYRDRQSGQIVVVTDFNTYAGSDYTTYTMSFGATVDIITHIS